MQGFWVFIIKETLERNLEVINNISNDTFILFYFYLLFIMLVLQVNSLNYFI
jgi:hypothetical protein